MKPSPKFFGEKRDAFKPILDLRRLSLSEFLKGISMTILASITIFFSFALFPLETFAALTPQEIFRHAEGRVMVLEILDEKGTLLSAHSALLLDSERAVSQCNLLTGAASLNLRLGDKTFSAKTLQKDSARNLCVLQVSGLPYSVPLKQCDIDPQAGSKVYAISNALGFGVSISEGVVSGIRQARGDTFIQFTAPIAPGSEGGGLFDGDGRLIGMINYQQRDGQNVNFALPARWLGEIAQRASSTDEVESWRVSAKILENELKWQELAVLAAKWTEALTDNIEGWLCLASAQEKLKNWPAAEKAYREVLKREPATPQARVGLSVALLLQKKNQEALDTARSTFDVRQEDGQVWSIIAYAEMGLGHPDEAKNAFERVAMLEPWNRNAYAGLVTLARARKDWNAAVGAQRSIVRFEPKNVVSWLELAELYLFSGRPERVLNCTERALEIDPASGDALLFKGAGLYMLKRYREATEALQSGLGLKPLRPAWGWGVLGDIYNDIRLYPEAIKAYREALKLDPKDPSLRGRLGIALKDNFQMEEALALFEQLKEENPQDPLSWRQMGFIYSYQAKTEKAIPAYEGALKLDAKEPKVWAALMEAYHSAGRRDDVKSAYQKLLAIDRSWGDQAYRRLLLPYEVTP